MLCKVSITNWGLITVWLPRSYFKQSRLRQPSMVSHQPAKALASGFSADSLIMSIISTNTSLTSPTIGTSTFTRLEILEGSISMWMILRSFCAKCLGLPITRSSKRAPTANNTSQCCMALLASMVPCMPSMPRNLGELAGYAPSPIKVLVHG